ncbi:MAG: HD domain-containing protein [Caldilineaceae bacterium]|nr:HD domain-containing protein [Caldilineaceae bacterium]
MTIPTLPQAQTLLADAETRNPGPWVAHSVNVARAAQFIAERHPDLDADRAYILGLLHDIGRREGVTGMRHVIDGYTFLRDLGYEHAARIALTHSFPYQHPHSVFGAWDCTEAEFAMLSAALMDITYDDYDRLLQLCDALALPAGFCLIEKRLIDVFMRYAQEGVGPEVHTKFQQVFAIQRHFEEIIGCSIYEVLPGVVETTFGEAVMATTRT